jgi:hypothetical protein
VGASCIVAGAREVYEAAQARADSAEECLVMAKERAHLECSMAGSTVASQCSDLVQALAMSRRAAEHSAKDLAALRAESAATTETMQQRQVHLFQLSLS